MNRKRRENELRFAWYAVVTGRAVADFVFLAARPVSHVPRIDHPAEFLDRHPAWKIGMVMSQFSRVSISRR
jgi:hypothetical protein